MLDSQISRCYNCNKSVNSRFFVLLGKKRLILGIAIIITTFLSAPYSAPIYVEIEPVQSTQAVFEQVIQQAMPDGRQGSVLDTVFEQSLTVEEYVREQFADEPIMAEIARCESEFRHFGKNGDIIRGEENSSDVGVMQINEYYHTKTADRFGINLYTLEGNIEYSKYLYEKYGTSPWNASSKCWGTDNHIAKK